MKSKVGIATSSALAALLFIGITGCGTSTTTAASSTTAKSAAKSGTSASSVHITVAWWGNQQVNNQMIKIIKLFEQKYPNIHVTPQYQGWSNYWTKLATEAAAKTMPDVMLMDYGYIKQYVGNKLIVSMSPEVKNGSINLSNVSKADVSGGMINGKLYGLNVGDNAPAMAYSPALFKKAGVAVLKPGYTWSQLAATATTLRKKLGSSGVWGIEPYDNSNMLFPYYLREKGKSFYNASGTALGYKASDLTWFFNYWQSLIKSGVAASPVDTQTVTDPTTDLIINNKAPFDNLWSNQITSLDANGHANYPLLPLPSLPGGKQGNWIKPSAMWSITSQSKQSSADAKWINFYTNNLKANETMQATFGVPINSKIRSEMSKNLSPAQKTEFKYIKYVETHSRPIDPPAPAIDSKIQADFTTISQEVNYIKLTPAQAATQFDQQAKLALKGN